MTTTAPDPGSEVLRNPLRDRGTAFDHDQRQRLGLTGRLPSAMKTLDEQAARCRTQLQRRPSPMDKYV